MAEAKTFPQCSGTMTWGKIMQRGEYTLNNRYLYVFAPVNESGPDLSKIFSGKPLSKERKALVAFACDQCGFTEFYTQSIS
jgi:predicted nucleic-acid-binding Zn-ribbon protein